MLNLLRMQCLKESKCVLLARAPAAAAAAGVRRLVCSASSRARQRASTTTSGSSNTAKRVAQRQFGSASGPPQKLVLLVDGNNLAMRAYFGIYKNPMSALQTTTGIPTTVSFGFVRTLLALLEQERPDALVVVFDGPGGNTPRRELLPTYKANRTKPAPDFAVDFANLKLLLRFTRIPTLTVPGYEADDVMAGLAVQARQCGWRTLLLSTDKDLWQVVDDAGGVSVLLPASGSSSKSGTAQRIDEAAVQEALGVRPDQVPELKALMGDSSDNIPGIPGIGIKTASALMKSHGSLSGVFANIHQEKKGVAAKLKGRQAEAELYKSLATVRPEAAPVFDSEAAHLPGFAAAEVEPLLRKLEMTSLLKDLTRMQGLMGGAAAADPQLQAALPAALQQVDASAAELQQGGAEHESGQQQAASSAPVPQPTAPAPDGDVESGDSSPSSSLSTTTTAAGNRPAARQEAADVLAAVPTVRLVRTPEGLQALLEELHQQQQLCVTWSWPQSTPYRPGDRQQPPPQLLCCAWQQQQSSKALVTSSTNTSSSSSSLLPESPAAPRRRRRTRVSTSALQQQQQQSAPQPVAAGVPSSEQQQHSGLQLAVILPGAQLPAAVMMSVLQPLLESSTHPKCLFESKRAYTELHHQGIQLAGVSYDVLVAGCLPDPTRWSTALDPERQQAAVLPAMVEHVLHTSLADLAAALQAAAPAPADAADVDADAADADAWVWQAAAEAWATLLLRGSFTQQMQDAGSQLQQLLDSMELPLQRVLSAMEVTGVRCDKQLLLQQRAQLQAEVVALAEQLYGLAGRRFNLNSPRECSTVIYEELGLKAQGRKGAKTTKSGFQSTSMSEIDKLEPSPFKAAFVEHARLSSLLAKYYGDAYLGAINSDTGRIHTTYQQVGIATGRLASSNPNMQAVPAHDDRAKMFRAAFTADEGHLLVSADYSQVELRVLAALSGDEGLLQAFAEDQDVHAATARVVLGKGPQDPLSAEERQLGKRVNFSIVYGAGARQLATGLGMTQKQAQAFMDSFKAAHPKLYEYKTLCMRSAVALGHTVSAAGRRRVYSFTTPALRALRGSRDLQALPDMKELQRSANRSDVHVLLQASNAPIQGTSADVLKAALLQLHTRLAGPPHFCRLMLAAHDDVVMEVPRDQWPDPVKGLVEAAMQGVLPEHRLMLRADIGAGASWLECKP